MCQQVKCPRCGKPTWTGCGRHIEQALAGVPPEKRCTCPPPEKTTFFGKLLGKKR
jgi:hypothetical protein